jgi:hypothetical protein
MAARSRKLDDSRHDRSIRAAVGRVPLTSHAYEGKTAILPVKTLYAVSGEFYGVFLTCNHSLGPIEMPLRLGPRFR